MRHCVFSGWLPANAELRRTASQQDVLMFTLVLPEEAGEAELTLRMRVEDPLLVARCASELLKGRTVFVQCFPRHVPVPRHGGIVAEVLAFVVTHVEIPNRAKSAAPVIAEALRAAAVAEPAAPPG